MSTRDDGGPAFPNVPDGAGDKWQSWDIGMSLRDYFAAKALAGMLANPNKEGANCGASGLGVFPRYAYEWADAMLKARSEGDDGRPADEDEHGPR